MNSLTVSDIKRNGNLPGWRVTRLRQTIDMCGLVLMSHPVLPTRKDADAGSSPDIGKIQLPLKSHVPSCLFPWTRGGTQSGKG